MKIRVNLKYLLSFIIVFAIETCIAIFIDGGFIRAYLGDVLVVVLIYCFVKAFVRIETKLLPLSIFIFAGLVEIGQYFDFVDRVGLSDFRIARIIIGTSFDVKDIVCYLVGCLELWVFELIVRKRLN